LAYKKAKLAAVLASFLYYSYPFLMLESPSKKNLKMYIVLSVARRLECLKATAQYGTKNAISNGEVGLDYYFNTTNSEGIIEKIWILDYQMAKTFS
jgi:Tat protein secretion system quality control protein TatD with DNase activity